MNDTEKKIQNVETTENVENIENSMDEDVEIDVSSPETDAKIAAYNASLIADASNIETSRMSLTVVTEPYFKPYEPSTSSDNADSTDDPTSTSSDPIVKSGRANFKIYYIRNLDFNPEDASEYSDSLDMIGLTGNKLRKMRPLSFYELHTGELSVMLDKMGGILETGDLQNRCKPGSIDYRVSQLVDILATEHKYTAALFRQTRLYEVSDEQDSISGQPQSEGINKSQYAFLYDGGMLFSSGKSIPAIRQQNGTTAGEAGNLDIQRGDPSAYKQALQRHLKDKPHLQLILGQLLSGLLRQILYINGVDLGETSVTLCITGDPGTGKTSTTKGLKESLFGVNGNMTANSTSIKTGSIIRDSGICPVLIDDTSVEKRGSNDIVKDLYHMANGLSRSTYREKGEVMYAPVLQSREKKDSLKKILSSLYRLDGFIYRVFELDITHGDLATSKEEAEEIRALSTTYSGQAIEFIRRVMQEIGDSTQKILDLYRETMKFIQNIKDSEVAYEEIADRVVNRAAVIILAIKLAAETYGFEPDLAGATIILLNSIAEMKVALNRLEPDRYLSTIMDFYEFSSMYPEIEQPLVASVKQYNPAVNLGFIETDSRTGKKCLMIPFNLMNMVVDQDWKANLHVDQPNHLPLFVKPADRGYRTLEDVKNEGKCQLKDYGSNAVKTLIKGWVSSGVQIARQDEMYNIKDIRGVKGIKFFKFSISDLQSLLGRYGNPRKEDLEDHTGPTTGAGESHREAAESSIDLL